jgi:membrane-associated phospholipid phosphatase
MQQEDREENGLLSSCLSEARRESGVGRTDRCRDEQARTTAEGREQAPVRDLETQQRRRKVVGCLLQVYFVQLLLFGLLAWFVHVHPILPLDVAITRSFQHNQAPWLRISMLAISYPGSSLLLPALVILTVMFFWVLGLRLEAVWVGGLSIVSLLLNLLLKIQVGRPRPTANLVTIIQAAVGYSFPSGHVMAYLAYWGLLFSFAIILFTGRHWWRTTLLITSAAFVVLIGLSRIYLGDHWASDVLGAYLIGGVLLGLAVGFYLPLKERGVLETPEVRARMKEKKVMRTFPTKGWF